MGNIGGRVINKVNYENIQELHKYSRESYLLINTLPASSQKCLIVGTIDCASEEECINTFLSQNSNIMIIIYGKNCEDESIYKKYEQLLSLGFNNVYIYVGGLFEWLCLQDIYGQDNFKTTSKELDILKFKSSKNNTFFNNSISY